MASGDDAGPKDPQNKIIQFPDKRSKNLRPDDGCATEKPSTGRVNQLVELEILPRLLVAHVSGGGAWSSSKPDKIYKAEADKFAELPLSLDVDELLLQVEAYIDRGVSIESVFTELLAPSARRMGQFWEDDTCDFVDVTMALWRLQEVMREIALRYPVYSDSAGDRRSALFAPMPGEQHCFGTLMVEEVFARAGWDTEALIEPQRSELLQSLAERTFDVVGLTVSNDCPSGDISSLIAAIRSVSKCRSIKVLIGGRVINANPGLVSLVGADGTAADARSALILADRIVAESKRIDAFVS